MNQKVTHDSMRFSPLALALVLFVVLGLLALTTHAQGPADDTVSATIEDEVGKENLFEQQENRTDFLEAQKQARTEFRAASGTPEDFTGAREEAQQMIGVQGEEQEALFSSVRENMRAAFVEQKEILKAGVEARREARIARREAHTARLSVAAQARLSEYAERMVARMDTTLDRLLEITDRVGSRLEVMEERGADLREAKQMLENVYVLIDDAREYIVLAGEVSMETFLSESPELEKEAMRASALLAKEGIREVHTALSETVRILRLSALDTLDSETVEPEDTSDEASM